MSSSARNLSGGRSASAPVCVAAGAVVPAARPQVRCCDGELLLPPWRERMAGASEAEGRCLYAGSVRNVPKSAGTAKDRMQGVYRRHRLSSNVVAESVGKVQPNQWHNLQLALDLRPSQQAWLGRSLDRLVEHSGGVAQGGFVCGWIDAAKAHPSNAQAPHVTPKSQEQKVSYIAPARPGAPRAGRSRPRQQAAALRHRRQHFQKHIQLCGAGNRQSAGIASSLSTDSLYRETRPI